ncbi:MAG: hypothetical protein ACOY40_09975 [Bacillota bacterium]
MKINRDAMAVAMAVLSAVLMISALMKWYLVFAWATVLIIMAYAAIGGQKKGSLGPIGPVLLLVGAVLLVAFAAIFSIWTPGKAPTSLVLGFHPATAILVYVIWLFPIVLGIAYALNFSKFVLTEEEFESIKALKGDAPAGEAGSVPDSGKISPSA